MATPAEKIVPNLWFTTPEGKMSALLKYYKGIFKTNFVPGKVVPLGNTPSGNTEMCEVRLFKRKQIFMTTAQEHHPFNDAVSWMLVCADQKEIDRYWNYFTKEGKESMCGWCVDKYGVRWQVIPKNMGELMRRPNAWKVMMGQKKIVIKEYLA